MATTTKKEHENRMNPWWDAIKTYSPEEYQGYVRQWFDAVESYQDQVANFHKTLVERTEQAWDESYKLTREGLKRSSEFVNVLHDMTRSQIKQMREHL